ncbi:SDR family oxidoreductase [Nesterenkonia halotolerans]|uniref:NAD(P)-dependent dehydrogenase (Short-subunit alcohol dehydrogenase family) n=1 Tax=Nesterenkonia halotolerans TaxID=225325 RepID=A0ABR9J621_9MICC|nr:SDR family oxidoreductase [Nesterenkonia halotolerans]MBE1514440.1 NAD(P)-dependent dehydrogenase (short-subunit alcohol dehydrogenase family) [Nesterenkonia halotolerans]
MSRTYVVTGSASGIGKATTKRLRDQGHDVIGVDLRDADVTADLSTQEGRTALVTQVQERTGGTVDGVIAVAGLVAASPVTVGVNYFGAVATLEGLRPLLEKSAAPRAVVVASLAALEETDEGLLRQLRANDEAAALKEATRIGTETNAAGSSPIYTTTKLAISQWVREHAKTAEWAGAGIALNAIAPGVIETPMTLAALESEEGRAALDEGAPSPLNGPAAPPAAPAALLSWLASEENTHVTGQIIFIDGGAESIRRPELV